VKTSTASLRPSLAGKLASRGWPCGERVSPLLAGASVRVPTSANTTSETSCAAEPVSPEEDRDGKGRPQVATVSAAARACWPSDIRRGCGTTLAGGACSESADPLTSRYRRAAREPAHGFYTNQGSVRLTPARRALRASRHVRARLAHRTTSTRPCFGARDDRFRRGEAVCEAPAPAYGRPAQGASGPGSQACSRVGSCGMIPP
jgi:hypothetical protein